MPPPAAAAAAAAVAGKVARRLEETPAPPARTRAAAEARARARAARELLAAGGAAWTATAGGVGFRLSAADGAGGPGGEPGLEARKAFPLFGGRGGWRAELAAAASAARLREGHVRAAYEAPAGGGRLACDVGTDFRGRRRCALDGERAAAAWGVAGTLGAALPAGAGPASVGVAGTRRLSPRHAVLVRLFRAGPAFGDRLAVEGRFRPDPDGAGEASLALERTAGGPAPGAAVRLRARAGPPGGEAPALEVEAHLVGAAGGADVSFSVSCGAPAPAAPAGWFPDGV